MGTWSCEPFGNDTANDWAYELENSTDFAYIEQALDKVLEAGDEYLDASDAEEAIAAVEVIAKLLGRGTQSDAYTEKVDAWINAMAGKKPTPALQNKAGKVLQRITSGDSELLDLWEEGDATEWKQLIEKLYVAIA